MASLFHRLAAGYSAGLDLRSTVEHETHRGSPGFRQAMRRLLSYIGEGRTLTESMQQLGDTFPPLVLSIVRAGEAGGRLEESFTKLAHHYEELVRFRTRFLQAIAWPVFELAAAIFVIGLLISLMGWLLESQGMKSIDWFGFGWNAAGNFRFYCFVVTCCVGGLAILIIGTLRGWFGLLPMKLARRIPVVGKTIESLALSRFAWSLSIADNAGMNPVEASRLALDATQNYYYLAQRESVERNLIRGQTYFQAFRDTQAFPDDFLTYIHTGEVAGQLAETLERASHNLQETAERNLKTISTVGFVLVFLLVAALMGFAIITMYSKIYSESLRQFL
ncbi:MAG TPA: type II secretion system F family protein [Pirellulaceae bacterium]|nr:type II secretion system F family protein [Pirellulaceae bacterium]